MHSFLEFEIIRADQVGEWLTPILVINMNLENIYDTLEYEKRLTNIVMAQ